jgi:vancomycin resistance protein YoaR
MHMMKRRYILLFFLLFVSGGNVLAAPTQTAAPAITQDPSVLTVTVGQYSENIPQNTIDTWITHASSLSFDKNYTSEFEDVSFCPSSIVACTLEITAVQRDHLRYSSQIKINEDALNSYVGDLASRVNHDPVDAKFQIDNGKVSNFASSQDGVTLKNDASVAMLSSALENYSPNNPQTLALPFDSQHPQEDYKDINDLGVSSLIGEGTSNFRGSPANRIHNIQVGIKQFNGVLIKPGEEFSFIKALGDVDAAHGYLPELVIKGNQTEPDYGGGICQVSTTMFRAALYSGLKITDRRNHAYPVSYYNPQGMDATVFIPNPDLRFINNTPSYILVQTKIVGTILTFDFYGTDDGRKTTLIGPTVTDKQPDGSLKTTLTQNVIDKNGSTIINDVFNSDYNSPYLYPHPGGPVLAIKPDNWSNDQWKAYKKMIKDMQNS